MPSGPMTGPQDQGARAHEEVHSFLMTGCVCPQGQGPGLGSCEPEWEQGRGGAGLWCGTCPCPQSEPKGEGQLAKGDKQLALSLRLVAGEPRVTLELGAKTILRSWEHFQPPEVPQQLPAVPRLGMWPGASASAGSSKVRDGHGKDLGPRKSGTG